VASAAESEAGACFQNTQAAAPLRTTLLELGHKQPANPLRTDNSTSYGILNETLKQKRSKSMDMKHYWLQDRERQKQFDIYWCPGKDNFGNYHTKHNPAQHHQDMRPKLLHQANSISVLRGCAKLLQPKLHQPTDTHTFDVQRSQRTLMATQVRCVLIHAYADLL
jgi:hypothetical protein